MFRSITTFYPFHLEYVGKDRLSHTQEYIIVSDFFVLKQLFLKS